MTFPFKPEHILMNEAVITRTSCAFIGNLGFWSGVITGAGLAALGISIYIVYDALKQPLQNEEDGKSETRNKTEEG